MILNVTFLENDDFMICLRSVFSNLKDIHKKNPPVSAIKCAFAIIPAICHSVSDDCGNVSFHLLKPNKTESLPLDSCRSLLESQPK